MFKKKHAIYTVVDKDVCIDGDLSYSNGIKIEGKINGAVKMLPSESEVVLFVGPYAQISGDIEADVAIIAGRVIGNVSSKTKIIIKNSAEISGDINYKDISVEIGAKINGKLLLSHSVEN